MPEIPARPDEVPAVGIETLAALCRQHTGALVRHRHSVEPLTGDEVRAHAMAALVYQHTLAERVLWDRWVCAVDALAAGASHEQVAVAMCLEPGELQELLTAWADGQREFGHMTTARHAEVLRLAGNYDEAGEIDA